MPPERAWPVRSVPGSPGTTRGQTPGRPDAPAAQESGSEFCLHPGGRRGGKGWEPPRALGRTRVVLRGKAIPFLKSPTIRIVERSTGGGKARKQNRTKRNSLNSQLFPGQRRNIESAGPPPEVSAERPSLDLLLLRHEYKYSLHLPYVTHALPQTPPPLPCWDARKREVCPPSAGRVGRRGQRGFRDNVTFLFVKILCQLLGK